MTDQEIFIELVKIGKEVAGASVDFDHADLDSRFHEDLGLDSIAMIYMVLAIEKRFGIRFDNKTLSASKSVRDIVAFIKAKA